MSDASSTLQREIKCKKPQSQYIVYQECGLLYLISQCSGTVRIRPAPCDFKARARCQASSAEPAC
eukprot:700338-Rhodomonas_salina.3